MINKIAEAKLPTKYGFFRILVYRDLNTNLEHVVLVKGRLGKKYTKVRIHSQCLTGDTFFSLKCDCGEQLKMSLAIFETEKSGVLIYLSQEGRGIGLAEKIKAYSIQEKGLDTVEANMALGLPVDNRDYEVVVDILDNLCIRRVELLTNNPLKFDYLRSRGVDIVRGEIETEPQKFNSGYLKIKKSKLGHLLKLV